MSNESEPILLSKGTVVVSGTTLAAYGSDRLERMNGGNSDVRVRLPRDDVERLIFHGDADDVRRALASLYDLALRETFVSNDDIANVVFHLVEDDE